MRQRLFFALLYFAEGAPVGFIWWALPAILTERGFALAEVSQLMALAVVPWSFKFVFGPLVDNLSFRGVPVKAQLFVFQFLMGLTALAFGYFIDKSDLAGLSFVVLLHATCAAAQDICIDTLAIRSVKSEELGAVNGYMQAGVLLGRSLFGGVSLFLVHKYGLSVVIYLLAAAIWLTTLCLFFSGLKERSHNLALPLKEYFAQLKVLFSQSKTWLLIFGTLLAGLSFKGISGVDSAALVHIGVGADERSILFALWIPLLMLIGAMFGGFCADRWNKRKAFNYFLLWNVVASLLYSLSFDFAQTGWFLYLSLSMSYLGIGMITTSLYAYLMGHTKKVFAAFEFSLFMAAVNMSESIGTWFSGEFSQSWGFFAATMPQVVLALGALACLYFVDRKGPVTLRV